MVPVMRVLPARSRGVLVMVIPPGVVQEFGVVFLSVSVVVWVGGSVFLFVFLFFLNVQKSSGWRR